MPKILQEVIESRSLELRTEMPDISLTVAALSLSKKGIFFAVANSRGDLLYE